MSQHTLERLLIEKCGPASLHPSWYRIYAPDGSTVAYCPDIVTADLITKAPEMYRELLRLQKYFDDLTLSHEDSPSFEDEKDILRALLQRLKRHSKRQGSRASR